MANPRDAIERHEEGLPDVALAGEHFLPGGGETVVAPAPLAGALHPAAFDEALVFEPIQRGIERRDVEADGAVGSFGDQPADLVSVPLALFEQGKDQHFRAAPLQLAFKEHRAHMWTQHIWRAPVLSTSRITRAARTVRPLEADTPLFVNADAVLTAPATLQRLEEVARQSCHILD